jgi:hypothetical protein
LQGCTRGAVADDEANLSRACLGAETPQNTVMDPLGSAIFEVKRESNNAFNRTGIRLETVSDSLSMTTSRFVLARELEHLCYTGPAGFCFSIRSGTSEYQPILMTPMKRPSYSIRWRVPIKASVPLEAV